MLQLNKESSVTSAGWTSLQIFILGSPSCSTQRSSAPSSHSPAFFDFTGPDLFCSTVFIFSYFFIFISGRVVE